MALPKLDVPIFTLELPLAKTKVRYRPFLVKEEKLLLMVMESDDDNSVFETIKQIVNNCCLDDIDVEELSTTDLEYFFLNLRARSVGEIVDMQYKCNNQVKGDDGEEHSCDNVVKMKVNILEIQPTFDEKHNNKIELSKDMGIVMKYPSLSSIQNAKAVNEVERILEIVKSCTSYIYDAENIYYKKDIPENELEEFIDSLTQGQFTKIQEFFETIPKIKKDIDFKCNKCGYEEKIMIEGLQNFFD
jgi:hypothetical protein